MSQKTVRCSSCGVDHVEFSCDACGKAGSMEWGVLVEARCADEDDLLAPVPGRYDACSVACREKITQAATVAGLLVRSMFSPGTATGFGGYSVSHKEPCLPTKEPRLPTASG